MEGDTNKEEKSSGPAGEPFTPPRKGGGNAKWFAIIGALIIVIAALAVLDLTPKAAPKISLSYLSATSTTAGPYTFVIGTNAPYENATVYWGDGASSFEAYNASAVGNYVLLTHTYQPGQYLIEFDINTASGTYGGIGNLFVLTVSPTVNYAVSYGSAVYNGSTSLKPTVTGQNIYATGASLDFVVSTTEPSTPTFQVVAQNATFMDNSGVLTNWATYNYIWNGSSHKYYYNASNTYKPGTINFNNVVVGKGFNVLTVTNTIGAIHNTSTGVYSGIQYTHYLVTYVSGSGANVLPMFRQSNTSFASGAFLNAELAPGGYSHLDPQIEYDTVSGEIMQNTLMTLVGYYQNQTTKFFPELATTNGTANTNYYNRTIPELVNGNWTNTKVMEVPGQVFNFTIRSNVTWQDGTSVTAYDVWYAFVRDMIFTAGPTGTPGWIQAQYLLPGNYYSFQYQDIMNNITYSNASNTVTFYFQVPMSQVLVDMLVDCSGAYIGNPAFYQANGEVLNMSQAGFTAYFKYSEPSNIPFGIDNNLSANGPYQINYVIPGSEVVLKANPNFAPQANDPAPHYAHVIIDYVNSPSQSYLLLKSGQAMAGGIPTSSWNLVQNLVKAGTIKTHPVITASVFWYNLNFRIDVKNTTSFDPSANLPMYLFDSQNVRKAFAYAYDYKDYIDYQLGNKLYGVNFGQPMVGGMIPNGFAYYENLSNSPYVTLPTYSMSQAKVSWSQFFSSQEAKALGVTQVNGVAMYKGAELDVPIAIYSADPVDLLGASTWASNLQQLGMKVDVVPINFNELLTFFAVPNPAAVWILGWAPDYPYPSDYLQPMALPGGDNSTGGAYPTTQPGGTYPYGNDFSVAVFNATNNPLRNTTTVSALNGMIMNYTNAFVSAGATAGKYYDQMNRELVNLTIYVYLFQQNGQQILSTKIAQAANGAPNNPWQNNLMFAGAGDFYYQYFEPAP